MNDWKPWGGKKLPKRYENTIVVVRYQNGRESGPRAASWWARWDWTGEPGPFDIVAYRRASDGE